MDNVKEAPIKAVKEAPVKTRESSVGGVLSKPAGWWTQLRDFLGEVRSEMKRVTWPSRKEVYATTIVVIFTSVFFGVYLWGLDLVLSAALHWLYRSLGATA
jgi:preprotein translocase subunit SecE